jgi:hypothetical protein
MVSVEAFDRSFSERLRLNSAILKNKYWSLPVDDVGHENYEPVGRGLKSSEFCGRWVSLSVCKNVEGHNGVFLHDVDFTGKVVVRHNHMWCSKSSCPVCFIRGWSVREARKMDARLAVGVKRGLGKVEHISVSVAVADRDLPEPVMRAKCRAALFDRGVSGGCMIFHGYRIDRSRNVLVWSPHYHSLCFIMGGFDVCRFCVHEREDCSSCTAFKGREVRGYAKDGYLVKVHDVRKTVIGSCHYQLNHATIRVGIKRFQSVTWFGSCACRKFKSEKVKAEVLCPVCSSEMVKSVYVGKHHIVKDIGDLAYVPLFLDDEFDGGLPNYIELVGGRVE